MVATIFFSACVALVESIDRLINPQSMSHLGTLAAAGVIGFVGNETAAWIRLRAGRRLQSPALVADGYHARTDGLVSLSVVLSAAMVAVGLKIADPIIGLIVTLVILRITWQSFHTVRTDPGEPDAAKNTTGRRSRRSRASTVMRTSTAMPATIATAPAPR